MVCPYISQSRSDVRFTKQKQPAPKEVKKQNGLKIVQASSLSEVSVYMYICLLNRNQRCERPIFTRSHLRSFCTHLPFEDFMEILHHICLLRVLYSNHVLHMLPWK